MLSGSSDAQVLRACCDDPAFRATRCPYLVLDGELTVVGANAAFRAATLREPGELTGRPLPEVFPDAPGTDSADLTASLSRVLRLGHRDHLPVRRHDVPAPAGAPGFVERVWVTVNSPLVSPDGRVIGVLHHAEDVTGLLSPGPDGADLPAAALARALERENSHLRARFARHASIEQAKGALMAQRGCSADEAFALLRRLSHETNVKLHVVAEALLADTVGG
ncbi:ANTAR domain-containing protein [Pseudonocardia spirodelae]|uniref:ANTAR domain-containing protein n=1 Tax=Pseudonocardia spirodelae TaxID=3133431 RepID=A0ABU8TAX8_9PSEU